mmetsp:Transcript_118708/g.332453  ORF Transcript_118708/g.332453 Transcript_118708/m.332453 type:complete len:192 (-) Transcript_118708:96-671(-)
MAEMTHATASPDERLRDVPSFGGGEDEICVESSAVVTGVEALAMAPSFVKESEGDDELSFAASVDKVQEMSEQLAEFLVKFSDVEQRAILAPFLSGIEVTKGDPGVEPHIDEARQFICHYLSVYSEPERDLILEKWRPAFDTASLSTATESLTPSVTPPGSVTPTAVTPREFLSARRNVSESHPLASPGDN